MARFTAFASDTSEDEDERMQPESPPKPAPPRASHSTSLVKPAQADADMSESESSVMDEDELYESPPHRLSRDRNALVEGEDGEIYHAHELDGGDDLYDEDSRSSSSSSPPPDARRDQGIIPWAQKIGVDAHKLHVMQASLFRMPEEAAALQVLSSEKSERLQLVLPGTQPRKHNRDSEGDATRLFARERASFAHDLEPTPYRPSRKYARVQGSASAVKGSEGVFVDAGLAMGRSFRVGWGPAGTLVHLGELCSPAHVSDVTANSSTITKTILPFSRRDIDPADLASNLLAHHLSNSRISPDADGIPFASPSSHLTFASFLSLFPATERSFEALLFRLGHALFDELDLHLKDSISVDVRNRIYAIRRKAALSTWLEEAVFPAVAGEVKSGISDNSAEIAFNYLTGHQVEQACDAAVEGENIKLSTLISQAGGDYAFLEDLRSQLRIWEEERVDAHIDPHIRKVYALLAGIVDVLEGPGLETCLWAALVQHWRNHPDRAAPPRPWYAENTSETPETSFWRLSSDANPPDALYYLIKLFAEPACSLSQILSPLAFGPSPLDYSLSWHLYVILSRCMRMRDFADRGDPGVPRDFDEEDEENRVEGHSPSADLLTGSYASQLEQMGLIQEAAFVLLHIEGSAGREKAIKELLARSASKLDDWMIRGIAGSLKIPLAWVNEAKAIYTLNNGNVYEAYELYLQAGLYPAAHELAVLELAPEAVIRDDLELLRTLFSQISGHTVDGWPVRGKAFLDYAHVKLRLPQIRTDVLDLETVPDAAQASELEELVWSIPRLIAILSDVLRDRADPRHNVALSVMIANLTRLLDTVDPLALSQAQARPMLADEATKLRHAQSAAYTRFLKIIEVA
ncbi:hypothetical protein EVG20_g7759 [Dentipellis fragilis]|uniref:Nuclear pore complex protein NUP96 C-terminal domain-containing protein n=1 Tax=Dentipellis fragilis TaxID=205917 RepID=A0A4Y9YCW4_9AGAM|nr:hypothetical protein EVG20_g7759 [Dentipellis fragilis]